MTPTRQVTLHGGMTYEQLCPLLEAAGWALPNLPSLKHVTVVGACMTSTHGSGDQTTSSPPPSRGWSWCSRTAACVCWNTTGMPTPSTPPPCPWARSASWRG